jgi:hypothetical protein
MRVYPTLPRFFYKMETIVDAAKVAQVRFVENFIIGQ